MDQIRVISAVKQATSLMVYTNMQALHQSVVQAKQGVFSLTNALGRADPDEKRLDIVYINSGLEDKKYASSRTALGSSEPNSILHPTQAHAIDKEVQKGLSASGLAAPALAAIF